MRALLMLVLLLAGLWTGWWFYGARQTEAAFEGWLAERAALGEVAEADVAVRGFPSRFDTTLSDLEIGFGGWLWQAETFQTLMLAYAPNRAVAVWPGPQRLTSPSGATTVIEAGEARASGEVGLDAALELESVTLVAREVVITGPGWDALLPEFRLATRAGEGLDGTASDAAQHHVGGLIERLVLPDAATGGGLLPAVVDEVRLDAVARFDRPVTLNGGVPAQLVALDVGSFELRWGDVALEVADGRLSVDGNGFLAGSLPVRVRDYERLVEMLAALGLLPARQSALALTGLSFLAGGGDDLTVPLSFSDGDVRLGPLRLGDAPRLR